MCGIIGYIGKKDNCLKKIISGLEHLEYRGYDSAGICYLNNNKLKIIKEVGKNQKQLKKMFNTVKLNIFYLKQDNKQMF